MTRPLLRFAIVSAMLLALVIYYATRLQAPPEPRAAPSATNNTPQAVVATSVPGSEARPDESEEWFPDLGEREALPTVISTDGWTNREFDCDVNEVLVHLSELFEPPSDGGDSWLLPLANSLSVATDSGQLIAALHINRVLAVPANGDERQALRQAGLTALESAVQLDASNPMVLWYASGICNEGLDASFCSDAAFDAAVQSMLGSNAAWWAREARSRFAAGERAAALEALQTAAVAPGYNDFYAESIAAVNGALGLVADVDFTERALVAYALVQESSGFPDAFPRACRESEDDPILFDACVSFAERQIADSSTLNTRVSAAEFLGEAYQTAGRLDDSHRVRRTAQGLSDLRADDSGDLASVVLADQRVLTLFMEELEAGGEIAAMRFAQDEVARLKQDPEYSPCPTEETNE